MLSTAPTGEPDRHGGSPALFALDFDSASGAFHDGLGDRQPQPRASGFARSRTVLTKEAIEHVGKALGGNAGPEILDLNEDSGLERAGCDQYLASVTAVLDG